MSNSLSNSPTGKCYNRFKEHLRNDGIYRKFNKEILKYYYSFRVKQN